jgi:hypothetical protein
MTFAPVRENARQKIQRKRKHRGDGLNHDVATHSLAPLYATYAAIVARLLSLRSVDASPRFHTPLPNPDVRALASDPQRRSAGEMHGEGFSASRIRAIMDVLTEQNRHGPPP